MKMSVAFEQSLYLTHEFIGSEVLDLNSKIISRVVVEFGDDACAGLTTVARPGQLVCVKQTVQETALPNTRVTHEAYNAGGRALEPSQLRCVIAQLAYRRVCLMALSAARKYVAYGTNNRACIAVSLLKGRIVESITGWFLVGDIVWWAAYTPAGLSRSPWRSA